MQRPSVQGKEAERMSGAARTTDCGSLYGRVNAHDLSVSFCRLVIMEEGRESWVTWVTSNHYTTITAVSSV